METRLPCCTNKTTMVVYEHRQKARDNHRYTYSTTMNEQDSFIVGLYFKPHPLVCLKLPWQLRGYHGSPGIIMVQEGCIYSAVMKHDDVLKFVKL